MVVKMAANTEAVSAYRPASGTNSSVIDLFQGEDIAPKYKSCENYLMII
jgi:hypothetical protein